MFEDWDNEPPVVVQTNNDVGWNGTPVVFTNSNQGRGGSGGRRGSRGRDRGGWRNDRQSNHNERSDNNCEVIKIRTTFIGRIIGKGGHQIEELQCRSGARIHVTKVIEGDDTIIKIFGSDECITKAKEFINETIEERNRTVEKKGFENNIPSSPSEPARPLPKPEKLYLSLEEMLIKEKEYWSTFPTIIKNFYEEHPDVSCLTEEQVEFFRAESNNIVVERTFSTGNSKPILKPIETFEQAFHNYPEILNEIFKAGFQKPSPIQSQAWPILLSGEDMIGIAQTGTGKTLAFLLPALIHIEGQTTPRAKRSGPSVLIVAPTRELALQIDKEVNKYNYKGITSCCVYGGADRKSQAVTLRKGVDIVIATPGRMNDLHTSGDLNVESITYVVLDEADRMLDMGFEAQIRKVMYSINPTRQSVMTSATWPSGVRRLAVSYMKDPIQVYVGSLDLATTHSVTQIIHIIDEKEKEDMFFDFVTKLGPKEKVIVFCSTKAKTDYVSVECIMKNLRCTSIHSNREQADRELAIADITDGTANILIATDVASRGLDIDDVTHVINFDFPKNIEEYVHRVGRTGRAGKRGESISYFTREDWANAEELIKILEEANQKVPEELHKMAERFKARAEKRSMMPPKRYNGGGRRW